MFSRVACQHLRTVRRVRRAPVHGRQRRRRCPPGSASVSSRAATFTPSPAMSVPSTMMSPRLMPKRKSMRSSARHRRVVRRHRTLHLDRAAMQRGVGTCRIRAAGRHRSSSPVWPPCAVTAGWNSRSRISRSRACVPASSCSMSRVYSTASAITIAASRRCRCSSPWRPPPCTTASCDRSSGAGDRDCVFCVATGRG